jgi:menaquinone-dependent protoporphyrinogen oxidase
MSAILVLYSTVDGHTVRICERLRAIAEGSGHRVTLASMDEPSGAQPEAFDKVVIGASIRYGKHRPNVVQFMRANANLLSAKPTAFFSVNIVARKPNKNTPETNPYVRRFFRQIGWRPRVVGVFAGKLDYPRYGFWDRQIIRFIMLLTKGPTDPRAVVEFTDWREVERFARTVSDM